ncbi:hypothetical protein [Fimbriiglobus ruber]|uniref:hypothetical protein n=1 Tax=Fimbriiglobus ruber TaxID=1908690 RepID=UPI00117B7331|nr:hypothetical protein [Fimbriiglobus ruber]
MHPNTPQAIAALASGDVVIIPASMSKTIDAGISQYPRSPTAHLIDWSKIANKAYINWLASTDEELTLWIESLCIANYTSIIAWYNPFDDCIMFSIQYMKNNFDYIVCASHGSPFYLIGTADGKLADTNAIIEIRSQSDLFGTL